MKEQQEEYTGFNTQADPEFLYAEDEQLGSEQTRDLYSDLDTVYVEPKKVKPFLNIVTMSTKVKYTGIEGGYRTIEVPNPEFAPYKRKLSALTKSKEIWDKRAELAEVAYKEYKKVDIQTPDQSNELKRLKKIMETTKKTASLRESAIADLGEEPAALITQVTDVKVNARDLREYHEELEKNK